MAQAVVPWERPDITRERAELDARIDMARSRHGAEDDATPRRSRLAQWFNWPNWRNWSNWNNWRN